MVTPRRRAPSPPSRSTHRNETFVPAVPPPAPSSPPLSTARFGKPNPPPTSRSFFGAKYGPADPTVRPYLTSSLRVEVEEAFFFFDGDRDGRITVAELQQVLRACGFALTDAEFLGLAQGIEVRYGGLLNRKQLLSVVEDTVCPRAPQLSAGEAAAELRAVRGWCAPFAVGSGAAAEAHARMRNVLTRSGDSLTTTEFVNFLRLEAPPRFRALADGEELRPLRALGGVSAAALRARTSMEALYDLPTN